MASAPLDNSPANPHVESIKLDDLDCWRINFRDSELLIAKQGAQILSYQIAGEQPLIWLNEAAVFKTGKAVRTGMPVCWPWFGNLDRNPPAVQAMRNSDTPPGAHGLARTRDWTLRSIDEQPDALVIEFALNNTADTFAEWPHAVSLSLRIRLDHYLHVDLISDNHGTETVSFSQALHSYFAVSDVRQVRVEGLDGLNYVDTLINWQDRPKQVGELLFTGETDRIYLAPSHRQSIVDPAWGRRICLQTSGSNSAVVWNPWIEKTARFSDMAADGWQRMLCIETANVLDDIVTLQAGESHTMSVSIWGEKLEIF